jgi:predicted nucleotidyltransferase component of viral defense system
MLNDSPRQYVELFHLLFLDQLGRKMDKKLYALKGGCNLRFYFNSIRYSEDVDIDVKIISKDTLYNKVQNILSSTPFKTILQAKKIQIHEINPSKQTETTQRWKISIRTQTSELPLNTKIEFSRREADDGVLFEPVSFNITQQYQLSPIMLNHYTAEKAIEQKINALIFRSQTQARDIFDLYLLLGQKNFKWNKKISQINIALDNAASISFQEFKSQVIAFLPIDYQKNYDSKEIWETMVNKVMAAMEGINEAI